MSIAFAVALTGSYIMGDSGSPILIASKDTGNQAASQQLLDLKERLERATLPSDKLALLKEVSSSNDSRGKQAVMEYFMSLPPSEISTDPHSDFFKVGVFEVVVPLLDFKERKKFVENVLDNELINLRSAYSHAWANMYPMSLWKKIMSIIDSDDAVRDLKGRYALIAKDVSLPLQVRSSALAANMRYDLEKDKSNETQKLQYVLENIPYMPEKAIPWEHYNDKEKYNAYCDSEEYMLQRKRIRDWRDAGQEVIFEGNLAFLLSQGLKSLSLIVSMLEREDVSTERRNGLAEVASYIFARLRNLSSQERELADQLASKLEKYVDQMPDKGYFSKRYYAIQKLRIYYDHMGIKEGYPFKDKRTRQHPSFEAVANAQAIATNRVSGSSPQESTKRDRGSTAATNDVAVRKVANETK